MHLSDNTPNIWRVQIMKHHVSEVLTLGLNLVLNPTPDCWTSLYLDIPGFDARSTEITKLQPKRREINLRRCYDNRNNKDTIRRHTLTHLCIIADVNSYMSWQYRAAISRQYISETWKRNIKENQIWRVKPNEELDKLIKHKNIINYNKAERLSWFGHVQRMSDTRTVKKIFNCKPLTKRSQGRPN
jgi:hypothetical protein